MSALAEFPPFLWSALWTSTLAMLLVCGVRGVLRRLFGPHVAYASWLVVPVMLFAMLLPARTLTLTAHQIPRPIPAGSAVPLAGIELQEPLAMTLSAALSLLWLAGCLAFIFLMIIRQRQFTHAMGRIRKTGIAGVYEAEKDPGLPAAIGLLAPRIVMPPNSTQTYTRHEYTLLLAHERTHLAMKDHWVNAISSLIQALFWFNPVAHIASMQMRRDQELSCDARVRNSFPHLNRDYGQLILKTQLATLRAPLACQWGAWHPLKERIMQLKSEVPSHFSRRLGTALVGVALISFGYVAWAAQPAKLALANPADTGVALLAPEETKAVAPHKKDLGALTHSVREDVTRSEINADRARSEKRARERAQRERMTADKRRMRADQLRRVNVDAHAQTLAAQARLEADEASMQADSVRRAEAEIDAQALEARAREAAERASLAAQDQARAEAAQRAASDMANAARAVEARQAQANMAAKYDMVRRLHTYEKQQRGKTAVQSAERNLKSR